MSRQTSPERSVPVPRSPLEEVKLSKREEGAKGVAMGGQGELGA